MNRWMVGGWEEWNLGVELLGQSLVLVDTAGVPKWLY